jgi:hypothetical protein
VRLGDRGLLFTSFSGGGKSSLAVGMMLRGAQFVADDVVAIDSAGHDHRRPLRAEPGFGLASIRHDAVRHFGAAAVERLGPRAGADDDAVRVLVPVEATAVPITILYVIGRADGPGRPLIEALDPVDPRLLLASSYNFVIRTPDRMIRHLDVCARLARTARVFRIALPPDLGPVEVAEAVEAHAVAQPVRR